LRFRKSNSHSLRRMLKVRKLIRKIIMMSLMVTAPTVLAKEKTAVSDFSRVLERPLIMGASISADWSTQSPSKRLALRYTTPDKIQTHAFGGRPGRLVLASLPENALFGKSAVLAMDLFFWDSTLSDSKASILALDQLLKSVEKQGIPIVLGEIPELLPGRQPQRAKLNLAIKKACDDYSRCFLMPFIELHQKVMRDHFLEINGRRYTFAELVPDGLHLSATASEYLADLMRDVMSNRMPAFKK
jgi:hypothetical protein